MTSAKNVSFAVYSQVIIPNADGSYIDRYVFGGEFFHEADISEVFEFDEFEKISDLKRSIDEKFDSEVRRIKEQVALEDLFEVTMIELGEQKFTDEFFEHCLQGASLDAIRKMSPDEQKAEALKRLALKRCESEASQILAMAKKLQTYYSEETQVETELFAPKEEFFGSFEADLFEKPQPKPKGSLFVQLGMEILNKLKS